MEQQQTLVLFGTEVPIGIVRQCVQAPLIANEETIRVAVAEAGGETIEIKLQLVPGQNNRCLIEYLDWVTEDTRTLKLDAETED